MKALVVASAMATLALVGTARAEPVSLGGDQMDLVTGGNTYGFPQIHLALHKNVDVNAYKNIAVKALVLSLPLVKGNLAEAEAFGTAIGKGSFTQTLTSAEAIQDVYSRSASESVAAANGPHFDGGGGHRDGGHKGGGKKHHGCRC